MGGCMIIMGSCVNFQIKVQILAFLYRHVWAINNFFSNSSNVCLTSSYWAISQVYHYTFVYIPRFGPNYELYLGTHSTSKTFASYGYKNLAKFLVYCTLLKYPGLSTRFRPDNLKAHSTWNNICFILSQNLVIISVHCTDGRVNGVERAIHRSVEVAYLFLVTH